MTAAFLFGGEKLAATKSTEKPDAPAAEQVVQIPLSELHPFEGHPFKVVDDELMQDTVDSIMQFGVLTPAIARPDPGGGYEMVAGHRRLRASEIAGKETMPVIVRNMTDDEAIILMVDSNLQRENILPSERAFAYRMKLEALKHQGQRTITAEEPTSPQVGEKCALDEPSHLVLIYTQMLFQTAGYAPFAGCCPPS